MTDLQGVVPPRVFYTLIFISVLVVLLYRVSGRRLGRPPLPPGPKTRWFGGTPLPKIFPWRTYAEWRHKYGAMLSCAVSLEITNQNYMQVISYISTPSE